MSRLFFLFLITSSFHSIELRAEDFDDKAFLTFKSEVVESYVRIAKAEWAAGASAFFDRRYDQFSGSHYNHEGSYRQDFYRALRTSLAKYGKESRRTKDFGPSVIQALGDFQKAPVVRDYLDHLRIGNSPIEILEEAKWETADLPLVEKELLRVCMESSAEPLNLDNPKSRESIRKLFEMFPVTTEEGDTLLRRLVGSFRREGGTPEYQVAHSVEVARLAVRRGHTEDWVPALKTGMKYFSMAFGDLTNYHAFHNEFRNHIEWPVDKFFPGIATTRPFHELTEEFDGPFVKLYQKYPTESFEEMRKVVDTYQEEVFETLKDRIAFLKRENQIHSVGERITALIGRQGTPGFGMAFLRQMDHPGLFGSLLLEAIHRLPQPDKAVVLGETQKFLEMHEKTDGPGFSEILNIWLHETPDEMRTKYNRWGLTLGYWRELGSPEHRKQYLRTMLKGRDAQSAETFMKDLLTDWESGEPRQGGEGPIKHLEELAEEMTHWQGVAEKCRLEIRKMAK